MARLGKTHLMLLLPILLLAFLLAGCEAAEKETSKEAEQVAMNPLDSLPNKIDRKEIMKYRENYLTTKVSELGNAFFKNGDERKSSNRIDAFRLNPKQTDDLLSEMKSHNPDSVLIIVHWTFRKKGLDHERKPNMVPMLNLQIGHKKYSPNYYPMHPSQNPKLAPLMPCTPDEGEEITPGCAATLVKGWYDLPVDSIANDLYRNKETGQSGSTGPGSERIHFYTFDNATTKAILYSDNNYEGDPANKNYFNLYIGRYKKQDYNYVCTIIDVKDAKSPLNPSAGGGGGGYFEFSRPCPTYCDSNPDAETLLQLR